MNCALGSLAPCAHQGREIEYVRVAIPDDDVAAIAPYFSGASAFIGWHLRGGKYGELQRNLGTLSARGEPVSVRRHCKPHADEIYYLTNEAKGAAGALTRDGAFRFVKRRRPLVAPNACFWGGLGAFEASRRGAGIERSALFDLSWCRQSCADFSFGTPNFGQLSMADCS